MTAGFTALSALDEPSRTRVQRRLVRLEITANPTIIALIPLARDHPKTSGGHASASLRSPMKTGIIIASLSRLMW
jgi:hypothetical protein